MSRVTILANSLSWIKRDDRVRNRSITFVSTVEIIKVLDHSKITTHAAGIRLLLLAAGPTF